MPGFAIVSAPAHVGHAPAVELDRGVAVPSLDDVRRVATIEAVLEREPGYRLEPAVAHGDAPLLAVHSAELVAFLAGAWEQLKPLVPGEAPLAFADVFLHERLRAGLGPRKRRAGEAGAFGDFCFDTISAVGPDTYAAARAAVDVAVTAADAALAGGGALGLTRPPGHHVTHDLFGGGCFFNNAAVAAQRLRDSGCARVAVLDVDYHHGNGTQSIFYGRGDVLFASLHASPARAYPFHLGWEDERGTGEGEGANVNALLPPGADGDVYLELLDPLLRAVRGFGADALVVSLGLDTFAGDPFDGELTTADFARVGQAVGELDLPTAILLEGGYDLARLGANVASWVGGLRSGAGLTC
jgi:acetoin utilization deacetylase AcuC-like enzyme